MDSKIMTDMVTSHKSCTKEINEKGEVVGYHIRPLGVNESLDGKLQNTDIQKGSNILERTIAANELKMELCAGCDQVPCINKGHGICSLPTGAIDAKVMFINKQPTDYEAVRATCCCDRNGLYISLILDKINVPRESVYFTDMIKCNAQLDEASFKACINAHLMMELTFVHPSIIICNSLPVLKACIAHGIIKNLPSNVSYGNIYSAEIYDGRPVKITAIYDLDTVLQKEGDDYAKCKNELWSQMLNAFKAL